MLANSSTPVYIFIPARFKSSRFEGKPLADILGKSMIEWVYERAIAVSNVEEVYVLTDDSRIEEEVKSFGGNCLMTSAYHLNGTDRIIEAIKTLDLTGIIINLQGDEPLIEPNLIEAIITEFNKEDLQIVTACNRITTSEDLFDYNVVKVVRTKNDEVLYFSRNAIPAFKSLPYREWLFNTAYYKHIGIYAFRSQTLLAISDLKPSKLEEAESLEQLRWLENGMKIKCILTDYESISVDLEEDIDKVVQAIISENIDPHIKK